MNSEACAVELGLSAGISGQGEVVVGAVPGNVAAETKATSKLR